MITKPFRYALAAMALGGGLSAGLDGAQAASDSETAFMGESKIMSVNNANANVFLNIFGGGVDVTAATGPYTSLANLYCTDGYAVAHAVWGTNVIDGDVNLFCGFLVPGERTEGQLVDR